jgi:hypothetical protein
VRLENNLEVEVTSLSPGTSVSKKMKSDKLRFDRNIHIFSINLAYVSFEV